MVDCISRLQPTYAYQHPLAIQFETIGVVVSAILGRRLHGSLCEWRRFNLAAFSYQVFSTILGCSGMWEMSVSKRVSA